MHSEGSVEINHTVATPVPSLAQQYIKILMELKPIDITEFVTNNKETSYRIIKYLFNYDINDLVTKLGFASNKIDDVEYVIGEIYEELVKDSYRWEYHLRDTNLANLVVSTITKNDAFWTRGKGGIYELPKCLQFDILYSDSLIERCRRFPFCI